MKPLLILTLFLSFAITVFGQTVLDGIYIKCTKCDSIENSLRGNWLKIEQCSGYKWVNKLPQRIFFRHLDSSSKMEFVKYNWCFAFVDTSADFENDSTFTNWTGYMIGSIYKKDHSIEPRGHFPFYAIRGDTLWVGKRGEAAYTKQK